MSRQAFYASLGCHSVPTVLCQLIACSVLACTACPHLFGNQIDCILQPRQQHEVEGAKQGDGEIDVGILQQGDLHGPHAWQGVHQGR